MTTEEQQAAGWKWPGLAKKAHYYEAGAAISLCGRWLYTGPLCRTQGTGGGPDDCKQCVRQLAKQQASA